MHLKCPFAAPLTTGRAHCRHAQEVVRRGGSEYDCLSADRHGLCTEVLVGLKSHALIAFGVEDDLTSMPHSVLVKIQSGGLLGLQRLAGESRAGDHIGDIADLIGGMVEHYGSPADVPYSEVERDMVSFKLQRRARRG